MTKLIRYLFIILLCSHSTLSLSAEGITSLYSQYKAKEPNLHRELKGISFIAFQGMNQIQLMQRITGTPKIVGAGSGGFTFVANYQLFDGSATFPAAIKILPDTEDFGVFQDNVILARLTGKMAQSRYHKEEKIRPYSYDAEHERLEINLEGEENPFTQNINQFYEMQKSLVQYSDPKLLVDEEFYATIMVTKLGLSDMVGKIFKATDSTTQNTEQFLSYCLDIARGAMNINKQNILHGDIKPDNLIIVNNDEDEGKHIEYIDFDIHWDPNVEGNVNRQLRYTEKYRPPWITPKSMFVGQNKQNQNVYKDFYTFDPKFREDTYAIAKTIQEIYIANKAFINTQDVSLVKMINILRVNILNMAMRGPTAIPTTEQLYNDFKKIMIERPQDLELAKVAEMKVRNSVAQTPQRSNSAFYKVQNSEYRNNYVDKIRRINLDEANIQNQIILTNKPRMSQFTKKKSEVNYMQKNISQMKQLEQIVQAKLKNQNQGQNEYHNLRFKKLLI